MAINGIINNAARDVTKQALAGNPSVLAPEMAAPATTPVPTGIIGTASAQPAPQPPSGMTYKQYNGQQVMVGQDQMDNIKSSADLYNKQTSSNMSAQDYDKMLNPTTYGARWGVNESQMGGGASTATTPTAPASAQLAAPSQWKVTPEQTAQGQMAKMADPNNPYYQQWATAGAQDAAARGFTGNSSIRSTGIMDSVMRNATPIATSDAATYAKAAGYNADMPNQFAMKNADSANQMALANLSADTQKAVAGMSAQTQRDVAALNNSSQAAISQAHDANSALIASNDAAKSAYTNYVAAIAQIDQKDGMDEAAKRAAIITQTQIFNNAIAGLKAANPNTADVSSPLDISAPVAAVGGVDVSQYLNFEG